jgi:hypothetical protein
MNKKKLQNLIITLSAKIIHLKIEYFFPSLNQQDCQEITKVLNKNQYLKKLSFGTFCLRPGETESFAHIVSNNNTLQGLSLQGNRIGNLGAKYLAQALIENTTLRDVDLTHCSISHDGAKALAQALAKNHTLKKIYLTGNRIGNSGAKYIAQALTENKTLKHVDLAHCDISNQGAKALAEALTKNQTIKEIYLTGNQIEKDGMMAIYSALKDNITIKKLILSTAAMNTLGNNHYSLTTYCSQPPHIFRNRILITKMDEIVNIYLKIYKREKNSSIEFPKNLLEILQYIYKNANLIEKSMLIGMFDEKFYNEHQNHLPTVIEEQIDSILHFIDEKIKEYFIAELSHLISQYLALTLTDKVSIIMESIKSDKKRTPLTFSHYQLQRKEKITDKKSCSVL